MKRFAFFLGSVVIAAIPVKANAGWSRNLEGYGSCVRQTSDGGYIIAGSIKPGDTLKSYLVKTDEAGNTLWTKTYGNGRLNWVEQTRDGGYITAGLSDLIKTDNNGNVAWRNSYDSVTYDSLNFYGSIRCVQETSDEGYIVSGDLYRNDVYGGNSYVWYLKTSSTGDSLWAGTYGHGGLEMVGSRQILEISNGYAMLGYGNFLSGSLARLIKIDNKGDTLWTSDLVGEAYSMTPKAEEGFILSGRNSDEDMWLCRTDSLGSILWEKTYGTQGYDDGWSISTTDDGGFIVTGEKDGDNSGFKGDVWLVKIDTAGDTLWTKTYDSDTIDYGLCVRQTSDGGYITLAASVAFPPDYGIWLIKTDSLGLLGITDFPSPPVTPVTPPSSEMEIARSIGRELTLRYSLNPSEAGTLKLYDASGRMVKSLCVWGQGEAKIVTLTPGVYFCRLVGGGALVTRKVVVLD